MIVIGLSGRMKAGKNTFAELLKKNSINDYEIISFADKLKEICAIIINKKIETQNDKEETNFLNMTNRQLLQDIGMHFRYKFGRNFWINLLKNQLSENKNYIITDVRFKNECHFIKSLDGILFRINPENLTNSRHISETCLDDYGYFNECLYHNWGDLEEKCKDLVKKYDL